MPERRARLADLLPDEARRALEVCEPYLVASRIGAATEAPHVDIGPLHRFDPLRAASSEFISRVERLQARVRRGLTIPRWALYDCGEVPGAVFGFARPVEQGLSPVSLVVALPMLEPATWHVYALSAVERVDGLTTEALQDATLSTALAVLGATRASAVVPWCRDELRTYARLAPLELVTAWTPAHSIAESFTCRFDASPRAESGDPDAWIDVADLEAQRAIQREIESGARFEITGPVRVEQARTMAPLRRVAT